jgi:hypothetical protein
MTHQAKLEAAIAERFKLPIDCALKSGIGYISLLTKVYDEGYSIEQSKSENGNYSTILFKEEIANRLIQGWAGVDFQESLFTAIKNEILEKENGK